MLFNELREIEKERYIIDILERAIEISYSLPSPKPRSLDGIYSLSSNDDFLDNVKKCFTAFQMKKFEEVFFVWRQNFFSNDVNTWKAIWVIFDTRLSVKKKEEILGIKKSYIYRQKDQIIELIKRFLERVNQDVTFRI